MIQRECEQTDERLGAYLDGELTPSDRGQVVSHLDRCEACRTRLEQLRVLDQAARVDEVPPVAAEEWDACWGGVIETMAKTPARQIRFRERGVFWASLAAAGLALAMGLALYFSPGARRSRVWKTQREFSVEAIQAHSSDIVPICYYSEEADLTVVILTGDDR
jgi:anti-sigma factor RsiW